MSRLDERLARNLGISKTAVARLLGEARVTDHEGNVLSDRRMLLPDGDAPTLVHVDGEAMSLYERALVLQHKPIGVITALRDLRHPTAYDLLESAPLFPELRAVGRLDLESSGLLLWTTEGALIQRLTHPKRRVPRTYQVALTQPFATPTADFALEDGYRPEITALTALGVDDAHPALLMSPAAATAPVLASITVVGGAYHEVRRIFVALGSHVLELCRTRFGDYELPGDLPPGEWRALPLPTT